MLYGLYQHICCCRIMCPIHHKEGFCIQNCKSSIPGHLLQPFFFLFCSSWKSQSVQHFQCIQSSHRIFLLINSCQRNSVTFLFVNNCLAFNAFLYYLCLCCICHSTFRMIASAFFTDNLHNLRFLPYCYHMTALFNNSGLFLCNFRKGISKKRHMIHTDRYQNCKKSIVDNIGGIKVSTHSHFKKHKITAFVFKIQKRHSCLYFKSCRMRKTICCHSLDRICHLGEIQGKAVSVNHLSCHSDSSSVRI